MLRHAGALRHWGTKEGDRMRLQEILVVVVAVFLLVPSAAGAADFAWTKDFNVRAEADPSGFRARLAARFKTDEAAITFLLRSVPVPADAYIVLRLGEMSKRPTDYVVEKYKDGQGKGWGVIAKSLRIKPGSKEFHALKRGHDLYDDKAKGKGKGKGKAKGDK
jgi:hypothetical protein